MDEILSRFMKYVDKDTGTECWEWTAAKNRYGYGVFHISRRQHKAHRISYMLYKDVDLDGMLVIHHTCSNRSCVNPDHLQAVTRQDNLAEMLERRQYDKRIKDLEDEVDALRAQLKEAQGE